MAERAENPLPVAEAYAAGKILAEEAVARSGGLRPVSISRRTPGALARLRQDVPGAGYDEEEAFFRGYRAAGARASWDGRQENPRARAPRPFTRGIEDGQRLGPLTGPLDLQGDRPWVRGRLGVSRLSPRAGREYVTGYNLRAPRQENPRAMTKEEQEDAIYLAGYRQGREDFLAEGRGTLLDPTKDTAETRALLRWLRIPVYDFGRYALGYNQAILEMHAEPPIAWRRENPRCAWGGDDVRSRRYR